MSKTDFGFSIPQADIPKTVFEQLPDGKYPFQLFEAERAATKKDARNWMIVARYKVLAGPMAGKFHTEYYLVGMADEDQKKKALAKLVCLSEAVGYTGKLGNMEPYFDKQFCATIKNKPDKDDSEKFFASISKYENISAYSTAPAAPSVVGTFAPPVPIATSVTAEQPQPYVFAPPTPTPAPAGPWAQAA